VRIALVCPYDWAAPGGVQVHVRELGERLRSRGHEVLGLSPASARPTQPWVRSVGGPIRVAYGGTAAPISPWPSTRRRVRAAIGRFGPEVVHVHEPFAPSAALFALSAGPPVVATFHSGLDRSILYDAVAPGLRRAAWRIAVRIAVSERAAEVARRRVGGSFEIVPDGVDVQRFARASPAGLPGNGRRLLFVGRLHARKGFPVLVDAFARLATAHADLGLTVVGDGGQRTALERLPTAVRSRVSMLGPISNDRLPPIHAACDVFVAPNTGGESFGVVLVEAMAAGLPVVASRIGGFDEVVRNGVDGLLVPPGDPAALASALDQVLRDADLAERLSAAGRARASDFSWETVVPRLEALYERARAPAVR
jgi:phosphatidyl-myo-inositol alpha-mannosyltransferase